jgi:hypothetical protein
MWSYWNRARTQSPARLAVALSLGVVLALALYVAYSLVTGHQPGSR